MLQNDNQLPAAVQREKKLGCATTDLRFAPISLPSIPSSLRDQHHQFARPRGGEQRWAGERVPIYFSLSQLGGKGRQGATPALARRSPAAGAAHGGEGRPTLRRITGIIAYGCAGFACLLLAKTFVRDGEVVLASCCLSGAIGALVGLWLQIRAR
jgi:hypothetical protein